MPKSLSRLLIYVNHGLVANVKPHLYVFKCYSRKQNFRKIFWIYSDKTLLCPEDPDGTF